MNWRRGDAPPKLIWVPNLRWFLPHRFAISLERLSEASLEPELSGHYLQFAVPVEAASSQDLHYYLEPSAVSFWENEEEAADSNASFLDGEHQQEQPPARLVGYHPVGTLNGILVWRTHQPRSAFIPDERIAMSSEAVARPTTIVLICGWFFIALTVLLFWISLTATELGAASQREHGYGALFTLAVGTSAVIGTSLYRASWRRYWRQVMGGRVSSSE